MTTHRGYRQAAEAIAAAIADGTHPPGSLLPAERALAAEFGVTRNVVREALLALEISGLVEVRNGIGAVVLDAHARGGRPLAEAGASPLEILQARRAVEGEVAAIAARQAGEDDVDDLAERLAAIRDEPFPPPPGGEGPRRFHLRLAEATHNPMLAALVRHLWDEMRSPLFELMRRQTRLPESATRVAMRERILEAVEARDPDTARAAMHRHTDKVIEILFEARAARRRAAAGDDRRAVP